MSFLPTEQEIQTAILDYLAMRRHFVWRNNTGGRPWIDNRGKQRLMKFGLKGSADILGVHANSGRFIAVEVKRPGTAPTPEQMIFLENVANRGGIAFVARSVEDVINHGL